MTPPLLKICGLRSAEQAAAVARLGVDAIGVIGVPGSPRFLDAEHRPALFGAMRAAAPGCRGVLVVADPLEQQWAQLELGQGHAVVQLHGSETPQLCGQLRSRLGCEIWKALRIRRPEDLQRAVDYALVVDALLLDAWVPDQLGGTGHTQVGGRHRVRDGGREPGLRRPDPHARQHERHDDRRHLGVGRGGGEHRHGPHEHRRAEHDRRPG